MASPLEKKIEKIRKDRIAKDNLIAKVKERFTDDEFLKLSKRRFWNRLILHSILSVLLVFLPIYSYPYLATINQKLAIATCIILFILAAFTLSKSRRCGACGGQVVSTPAYCNDCGMTYLFHTLGRKLYRERAERIDAAVAKDIAKFREDNKAQYGFLERIEKIVKIEDSKQQDEEIIKAEIDSIKEASDT